jgi:hypothetical protein
MGERRGAYRVLVGKPERKRPLERPRRRGRIILKRIFKKREWATDWIDMTQDRDWCLALVNVVMNLRGSIKCG